jgi:hypothetical protein
MQSDRFSPQWHGEVLLDNAFIAGYLKSMEEWMTKTLKA